MLAYETTDHGFESVVVLGLGYVGLPLALLLAKRGIPTLGVDINPDKLETLRRGKSPIEDVSSEDVQIGLAGGMLEFSDNLHRSSSKRCFVIAVPTPLRKRQPDLSSVESASNAVGKVLNQNDLVILESTTYPGTTDGPVQVLLERASGLVAGESFSLGYSPERIDPGNETWNLGNTPKIVSGIDSVSLERVDGFYSYLGIPTVKTTSTRNAEAAKLLENTFRFVNVSLVNEIAMVASVLNIDIFEVIAAASTKPFGFTPFYPSAGVGGHCLPVDPLYLEWASMKSGGPPLASVQFAVEIDRDILSFGARKISEKASAIPTSKVCLLGLAYKADSGDLRESPSLRLARVLTGKGLEVAGFDPNISQADWPPEISRVDSLGDVQNSVVAVVQYLSGLEIQINNLDTSNHVCDFTGKLAGSKASQVFGVKVED